MLFRPFAHKTVCWQYSVAVTLAEYGVPLADSEEESYVFGGISISIYKFYFGFDWYSKVPPRYYDKT